MTGLSLPSSLAAPRRTHALTDPRPLAVRAFWLALLVGGLVIGLLIVAHIVVGTVEMTPTQVVKALLNQPEDILHRQVVWGLRLPRALVAVGAGAVLGLAGAILQSVTRNPLADSSLLGVSSGGVLAVVIWIAYLSTKNSLENVPDSGLFLPALAFLGGLAAAALVFGLSWRAGNTETTQLVLTGVLVGGTCSALTSVFLLWASEYSIQRALRWTLGSTAGRVWEHWHTLWPVAAVAIPLALACGGLANVLQLGDEAAAGLGLRVARARLLLLAASALLTAGAVAVVGNVGFIGLIGPHMARRLVGRDARRFFPFSAVVSALLLITADIGARTLTMDWLGRLFGVEVSASSGMPVGVVTALLGVPFFLILVLRRKIE